MKNQKVKGPKLWTVLSLLQWATSYFKSYAIEESRASAEILLAHTLEIQRIDLYLQYDRPLSNAELQTFKQLIRRRLAHEPVAYITGNKEFWSNTLRVTPDVLIPRPETECIVETASTILSDVELGTHQRVLELGTGSGAIVIALAAQMAQTWFWATDFSENAIRVAQGNAIANQLDERIWFLVGNWFAPILPGQTFGMIISNPPYIPKDIIETLQPEVCRYEPKHALNGGTDGLKWIKHIIQQAPGHLTPKGYLLLEIGHNQKQDVLNFVQTQSSFTDIAFKKDYSRFDRVVVLRKE